MEKKLHIWLTIGFILTNLFCDAQTQALGDSLDYSKPKNTSYVLIGLNYSSDWVYMGRSDSLSNPYLVPSMEYNHKSGIFINGSLSYLTNESSKRIDLLSIALGYDYSGDDISTGLSATGYFFNDDSYNIQSEMTLYSSAWLSYDFRLAEAGIAAAIGLGGSADGFASAELRRSFYLLYGDLKIRPGVVANWGTQQYYNEYYQYRSSSSGNGQRKGKGPGGSSSSGSTIVLEEVSKFRLLDYEFSIQIAYNLSRILLYSEATYAIPLNPAEVTIDEVIFEESLDNKFFWSAGISYRLFGND
ncbi:MAG: hypothetical protein ABJG78_01830 [Cyclobacteriaceae bacterium]